VAGLAAVLVFAVLRFSVAARDARGRGAGDDKLSAALQEAVTRLQAQERATAARADASERLSGEIISGLSAGLLVVGLEGEIRILNPAGRRMLNLTEAAPPDVCRRALDELALLAVIDECLSTQAPVVRRSVTLPEPRHGVSHVGITVSPLFDNAYPRSDLSVYRSDRGQGSEEQLRLKDSLARWGITAGIAHEFRNAWRRFTLRQADRSVGIAGGLSSVRHGIRAETESLGQVVTNFNRLPGSAHATHVDLRAICERAAEKCARTRAPGGDVEAEGEST
jgi:hypothetical protein